MIFFFIKNKKARQYWYKPYGYCRVFSHLDKLNTRLAEEILGNERMIERIVRQDKSLAERILSRIKDLAEAFRSLGNKEARAEYKRLKQAEKLFMQAIENAGYKYVDGKIEELVGENITENVDDADSDEVQFSYKKTVDNETESSYNLFTATDDFYRQVPATARSDFSRSLANKTSGIKDGEIKRFHIYAGAVYVFEATGYMTGEIVGIEDEFNIKRQIISRKEYKNGINTDTKTVDLWAKPVPTFGRESRGNISSFTERKRSADDDLLFEDAPRRNRRRNNGRVRQNFETAEEVAELIQQLRKMYGLEEASTSNSKSDVQFSLKKGKKNGSGGNLSDFDIKAVLDKGETRKNRLIDENNRLKKENKELSKRVSEVRTEERQQYRADLRAEKEKNMQKTPLSIDKGAFFVGGDNWNRTSDLMHVKHAL